MPGAWVLELAASPADPGRRVGGLALALRLALDAERAGASALVVGPDLVRVRRALGDSRLKLPALDAVPAGARVIRVPATLVVHREHLKVVARDEASQDAELANTRCPAEVAYGFDPIDVGDRESARAAERALFRSLRKTQDGWTSRWLNRHLSLALSRWLVRTPLHPNHVSVVILAIGLLGAWFAARGGYASLLLGSVLFQAQSVLDGCDGEMSRVTFRGSLTGEWLDTLGDDLTNYAFFGAAAWGLYATSSQTWYLVLGAVGVCSGLVASAIEYRYLIRVGSGDLLKYPLTAPDTAPGAFAAIRPLFKRDTFVFVTMLAALLDLLGPMLLAFSAGAVGVLASVITAELRMARERHRAAGTR